MLSVISRFACPPRAAKFLLRGDRRLNGFLTELKRGVEIGLGDFLGRAFEHDHVGFVADIDQVQVALEPSGCGSGWRRTGR